MQRRSLLKALAAAPLAGAAWLAHAQKKGMAMVEELQRNWKNYLAAGSPAPSADEPVKLRLLGDVPSDTAVREAVKKRQLVVESLPGSEAAQAIGAVAARLAR